MFISSKKSNMLECEYLVIGGGESGVMTARELARYGKKTILIEEKNLGGTFVHTDDVPKKVLMKESIAWHNASQFFAKKSSEYKKLLGKRKDIQSRISTAITSHEQYFHSSIQSMKGITLIQGKVEIVSKTLVEVNSETERHLIHFSHCVMCSGKDSPIKPNIPGIENISFFYQDTAFTLPEIPDKIGIIGITPHTLEVAHMYANLGITVEMYAHASTTALQTQLDNSAVNYTYKKLFEKGVSIQPKISIESVRMNKDDQVELVDTTKKSHAVSHVYIPLKHSFSEASLPGLARAGIDFSAKGIKTDPYGQTKVPAFSALGECNSRTRPGNKYALIHCFLEKHLGKTDFVLPGKMGLPLLASTPHPTPIATSITSIQSQHSVCTIGLTETEAIGQYGPIAKTRSYYNSIDDSFVKITYKKNSGEIVGLSLGGVYSTQLEAYCVSAVENKTSVRSVVNYLKTYLALQ